MKSSTEPSTGLVQFLQCQCEASTTLHVQPPLRHTTSTILLLVAEHGIWPTSNFVFFNFFSYVAEAGARSAKMGRPEAMEPEPPKGDWLRKPE